MEKTNVMRVLDQRKAKYQAHCLENAEGLSGTELAIAFFKSLRKNMI